MRRPIWMLPLALAALLGAAGLAATAAANAGAIVLQLNQSLRVPLRGAAANVIVANPKVADVMMTDSHSLIVLGKGYGVTQIMVTDQSGHMLMDSRVAVTGDDFGHVTVFRGNTAFDYSCAGPCQLRTTDATAAAASAASSAAASTAATPAPPPAPTSGAPVVNHP